MVADAGSPTGRIEPSVVPARSRRGLILSVGLLGLGVIAASNVLRYNSAFGPPSAEDGLVIAALTLVTGLWLVGAIVALVRDPAGPMWMILFAYVLAEWIWILGFFATPLPWTIADTFGSGIPAAIFVHALVAYPTGRLRPGFDRRLVIGTYAFTLATGLLIEMTWNVTFPCAQVCVANVLLVWPNDTVHDGLQLVSAIGTPIIGLGVIGAVLRHWRAAGPAARRTLLPAVAVLPFAFLFKVTGFLGINLNIEALHDFATSPIAIASDAIVPIALIIGIARARLGRGRITDLLVELGRGVPIGGLRDVLARALGDQTLQLAFPAPAGDAFVDSAGQAITLPSSGASRATTRLERDGGLLAVLIHDPALDAEDPGLVAAVGTAAGLALDNERLAAEVRAQLEEVRASRSRIVEAADDERRRVERDLHDGAQQRLVALTMRLEQAKATAEGSAALIDEATAELREAITEVRSLARGLHPTILTEAGLAAAVDSLAERTPIPVEAHIPADRFPAAIEATAYFVIAEALTNVARHAAASIVRVEGEVVADRLVLTVTDDGRGGADLGGGTGLRGLVDRVAAAGGTLEVASSPDHGTTVRAELPTS